MSDLWYAPNAAGSYTQVQYQTPASGSHWDKVDDNYDEDSTYIKQYAYTGALDTFNFPNPSASGPINYITVYVRCKRDSIYEAKVKPAIYMAGQSVQYGAQSTLTTSYVWYTATWYTNPWTGAAWTWSNLNSLEIGAWLAGLGYSYAFCTSVLIQIRYNAPPNAPSTPSGSIKHAINKSQSYSTSATDADGDNVKYRFNWNDGTPETETGFVASGQSASASHSWTAPGTYLVKAYTIDASGNASGWSSTLSVQVISPARSCYVMT